MIGPNAADELVLRANYYGTPERTVTILEGIRAAVSAHTQVTYARGCAILDPDRSGIAEAVELARRSQAAVVVIGSEGRGLSPAVRAGVTQLITIPAFGPAESLNAAVAAAIVCDNLRRALATPA